MFAVIKKGYLHPYKINDVFTLQKVIIRCRDIRVDKMKFDPFCYPYPSRRNLVYARRGMVATSQPLAAQAGLKILQKGGNAVDAAVAAASALTVVEPTSNGIGGDAFAILWSEGKLHGLNSSGPAPAGISLEKVREMGYHDMPRYGWLPVTVPGIPGAWAELSKRYGVLPLEEVLEPAVTYAREGYPVSPTVGGGWRLAHDHYSKLKGREFEPWFRTFAPQGRPPGIGEVWSCPEMGKTLVKIAESSGESFYKGELAQAMDDFSRECGGFLTEDDLRNFSPRWVKPLCTDYHGKKVWELPPNCQGITVLMALNTIKEDEFPHKNPVETYHRLIESMKLAMTDAGANITDPEYMQPGWDTLLSHGHARERRGQIGEEALLPSPGAPPEGGTVYLATADDSGNMVSYIQSNYMGFGSGLVVPSTGISLQNRGCGFSLDPDHVNSLAPGKRTFHTIIPGFLTDDNGPVGPFGVMGGDMQPQGHLQVLFNILELGLNPQAALDAPRWRWLQGREVHVESSFPVHIARGLKRRGHEVRSSLNTSGFGRGQIIWNLDGTLIGASEPRADG